MQILLTYGYPYVIIYLWLRDTIITGQDEKGDNMEEEMTDKQMNLIIKMILEILNGCEDLEQAKEKIRALLEN